MQGHEDSVQRHPTARKQHTTASNSPQTTYNGIQQPAQHSTNRIPYFPRAQVLAMGTGVQGARIHM